MENTKSSIARKYQIVPVKKPTSPLVLPVITKHYVTQNPEISRAKSLLNLKPKTSNIDWSLFESATVSKILNKLRPYCPPSRIRLHPYTPSLTEQLSDAKKVDEISNSLAASKVLVQREKVMRKYRTKSSVNPGEKRIKRDIVFSEFISKIRLSNALILDETSTKYFNFFVGTGNNSDLVRRTLRKRYWWISCDSIKRSHFVWTPTKNKKLLSKLPNSEPKAKQDRALPNSKSSEDYNAMGFAHVTSSEPFKMLEPVNKINNFNVRICNKLPGNKHLCSKKHMYKNLKKYYKDRVFTVIPLTFHISKGKKDPVLSEFEAEYRRRSGLSMDNLWIVKPGENTNRGKGISLCKSLEEVQKIVGYPSFHTFIIQKYIEKPLLIENRKFDIRCFALLTCFNGHIQGYFYQDGYIRTSGYQFNTESKSRLIHLTNDAVQKHSENYGKHENGNKLSYKDLQKYMDSNDMNVDFFQDILPQIKEVVKDSFCAVKDKINVSRKEHCFELFGYDFMVDQDFKVWLIEINTNPCLEESCSLLVSLLSALIENTFNITIDPIFPPNFSSKKFSNWVNEHIRENKYELILSE